MNDIFSQEEIKSIQDCIGNKSDIKSCFEQCQANILAKIKNRLNVNYLTVGLARLSNNNNTDAQSYHRDVKTKWNYQGANPNVYTIICYFDDASFSMGNKIIISKPGDIIIFNSTNLHKANNIDIFKNKQRRVLQYFHVFFNQNEEEMFYKNHSFCEHVAAERAYLTQLVDVRFIFEYLNLVRFFNNSGCDKIFMTNIKKNSFVTTIAGIKYYHKF